MLKEVEDAGDPSLNLNLGNPEEECPALRDGQLTPRLKLPNGDAPEEDGQDIRCFESA